MSPKTFLFFGRSGCGKGTQVDMLVKFLAEKDPDRKSLHIQTGGLLREFVEKNEGVARNAIKEVLDKGGLLPEFVPIFMWGGYMIKNITGNEHIFCDGLSRRPAEAPVLDSAFKFFKREKPNVILMDVSLEWAMDRLLSRGRSDDKVEEIKKRSKWFDDNVKEAISFFENNPYYNFIKINGEQTIDNVHQDILKAVGLVSGVDD